MKTAIIDLQFGDTGKGRVSAYFCKNYDWSVRFNGGNNAGHTVFDKDSNIHKFNHLPAGAAFNKKVALDSGMVIDLEHLKKELIKLSKPLNLYISENVHIIQEKHIKNDSEGSGLGSTKKGIAYVYSDRSLRIGTRIGTIINNDKDYFNKFFPQNINVVVYRGLPPIGNESALFEGAQGIMLDIDYGCYPYVTSSSVMPSMSYRIDKIIGVMKAYTSRVGDGPPYYQDVENLRILGDEFGTTTGRPRRCTWNDIDQLNYANSIVQPDEIVVTKLDILKDIKNIRVYHNGNEKVIGNIDLYKNYLLEVFPKIKYFSESPHGDLILV